MTAPNKTILDAGFGRGVPALEGGVGLDRGLVHSKGVRLDFPGWSWIFMSGLVATDDRMKPVGVGDIRVQTRCVLEQLRDAIASEGGSMDDVVRVRVYVAGFTDERFRAIHEERAKFFRAEHYPASTLVEVKRLIFPELMIEIDSDIVIARQ